MHSQSLPAPAPCAVLELRRPFVAKRHEDILALDSLRAEALSIDQAFARYGAQISKLAAQHAHIPEAQHLIASQAVIGGWQSRAFVLVRGWQLQAVAFLRERVVLGVRTGYFVGGDHMGDICFVCETSQRRRLLPWFYSWLLRYHAFRVQVQSNETHGLSVRGTDLNESCTIQRVPCASFWRHELGGTLDASFARFGKRTRRNLRHALRTVDQHGWEFVPTLTEEEIVESTAGIGQLGKYPASQRMFEARALLRAKLPNFFCAGLRNAQGEWMSTVSGVRTADRVTRVMWQYNAHVPSHSICAVMRALLIQSEVEKKSRRIEYVGGTNKLMEHCCNEESGTRTILVRRGLRSKLFDSPLRTPLVSSRNILQTRLEDGFLQPSEAGR